MRPVTAALALLLCSAAPRASSPPGAVQVGGCSGTLIYRDLDRTVGVSAAHCAGGSGSPVQVVLPDGRRLAGRWAQRDVEKDLVLFSIPRQDRPLQLARVPGVVPKGDVTAYGRHGLKALKAMGREVITESDSGRKLHRYGYEVTSGKYRNGDSGSGVYVEGTLVGVASHGDDDDELFSSSHEQLVGFLTEHGVMGPGPEGSDWGDKDRTREILALKKRVDELESLVKNIKEGPRGPVGPPGMATDTSGLSSRLESLEEWRSNFRATIRIRLRPV